MRSPSKIKYLLSAIAACFALIVTPVALADPSEQGAVASNGKAIKNPVFDASGEAIEKVITVTRGKSQKGVPNIDASRIVGSTSNGIFYHNGRILNDPSGLKVNIIWYGTWTQAETSTIQNLITGLNGSQYYNINTTYYDSLKKPIPNLVTLGAQITDSYSQGKSNLSDQQIWNVVSQAAQRNTAIYDSKAINLVLTSKDVTKTGFLTSYCGWHNFNYTNTNVPIQYAFIGNPGTNSACVFQQISPNGDAGIDAMASVIAHEIVETVTDPQLNAWYDSRGYENGDKCAWNFGTTTTLNGYQYNLIFNSKKYLIQQNWVNSGGGSCRLSY